MAVLENDTLVSQAKQDRRLARRNSVRTQPVHHENQVERGFRRRLRERRMQNAKRQNENQGGQCDQPYLVVFFHARGMDQSGFAPVSRTTFPHFTISAFTYSAVWSSDPPTGSKPFASSRSRKSALCSARLTESLSLWTTAEGVPAGKKIPTQV